MSIRHLVRKLDPDAVARVLAGVKHEPKEITRVKPPRAGSTYRAARRNAVLRGDIKGVWKGAKAKPETFPPVIRLNRSRNRFGKHAYVSTYAEARAAAYLYSNRPVV